MLFIEMLILLIGAHLISDYVLQTDSIATGKNKHIDPAKFGVDWRYWMGSHVATHGMAVYLITGNVWLGVFEAATHWIIDCAKCDGQITLNQDQCLHVVCKLMICLIAFY